jgi:Domain of unknown function (DUF6950)
LIHVIEKYANAPFVWGVSDCCQFVGECMASVTGFNPAAAVDYQSEADADDLLEQYGGLTGVISELLGAPSTGTDYRDGDVGLIDNGVVQVAGVFFKDRIICRTLSGLVDLPASRACKVWKSCQI